MNYKGFHLPATANNSVYLCGFHRLNQPQREAHSSLQFVIYVCKSVELYLHRHPYCKFAQDITLLTYVLEALVSSQHMDMDCFDLILRLSRGLFLPYHFSADCNSDSGTSEHVFLPPTRLNVCVRTTSLQSRKRWNISGVGSYTLTTKMRIADVQPVAMLWAHFLV